MGFTINQVALLFEDVSDLVVITTNNLIIQTVNAPVKQLLRQNTLNKSIFFLFENLCQSCPKLSDINKILTNRQKLTYSSTMLDGKNTILWKISSFPDEYHDTQGVLFIGEIKPIYSSSEECIKRKRLGESAAKEATKAISEKMSHAIQKITGQAINEKMPIEEQIQTISNYYESIIACMPNNVYWLDRNCVTLGCNDNVAKLVNLKSRKQFPGITYEKMAKLANWKEGQAESFKKDDMEVMSSNRPKFNVEEPPLYDENGKEVYYISTRVPLHNTKGNVVGVIGISVDITERKRMEQELKQAKLKAEESSELKSQFMMNMQHDLRTPASGIAAMLEIFAKDEKDSERKETLNKLANSSRKLLNILNAILEFDSIKKGTLPVLSEKFNLNHIIHDVEALEFPTANLKHLKIKTNIDERIPQEVIGDSFRLQRILINLLSNAIKFTSQGYIEIDEILWKQIDDKNILVQIIVKDTGIGIPKDKQQVIFERFTRLDPSNKGVYSGLGLGLSMVKQFVEEMNGSIEVNSDPGHGSTFICTLPFKLPDIAERSTETMHKASGLMMPEASSNTEKILIKILLVEDDEIAQLISRSLLVDEFHAQLDVVTTGQEAINLVKKSERLYDLILMDLGLPDGNGCEFTKQIHAISKETKKIPIVALTAHDNDETRQECRDYGMQDYLTKPLDVSKMEHIFQKWLYQTIKHKKEAKS